MWVAAYSNEYIKIIRLLKMTDLPPPPLSEKGKKSEAVSLALQMLLITLFIGLSFGVIWMIKPDAKYIAEKKRIEVARKNQSVYRSIAAEKVLLLEQSMREEREKLVAIIAKNLRLSPTVVEENFGWFTGCDESIIEKEKLHEQLEIEDAIRLSSIQAELSDRFIDMRKAVAQSNLQTQTKGLDFDVYEYENMTTQKAVDELLHMRIISSRQNNKNFFPPKENKYDRKNPFVPDLEAIKQENIIRSFAWLIEQENKSNAAIEPITDETIANVLSYVCDVIRSRVEFMTADIVREQQQ
jgi:hypothetical protein